MYQKNTDGLGIFKNFTFYKDELSYRLTVLLPKLHPLIRDR
jgi:hypothetical protein